MTSQTAHRLAAIRFGKDFHVDGVFDAAIAALRADGVRVAGFVQRETVDPTSCCDITYLEDVTTGDRHRISQALGAGSRGCKLDPQALAGVCGDLIGTLDRSVDLLVLNRFGKGESDGHGFRTVIEKALDLGIPVLTAVRDTYAPAFEEFAGDLALLLPAEADAVAEWGRAAADGRPERSTAA
ncbi:DUF2478 domain-containing protein [Nitratireductor sp. XY-223]|uniref:DUF2478 domain-containing protein n=1 Tax=Nitratireductor sp. XY-223 TaxID=2561926 RepID=UPI0010AB4E85|nr:DUF2478 domain-containing protein [Nitratireductor sp. XY-223]